MMIGDSQIGPRGRVSDLFGWMLSASSQPLPRFDNAQIWGGEWGRRGHPELPREGEWPFSAYRARHPVGTGRPQSSSWRPHRREQPGESRVGSIPSDIDWAEREGRGGFLAQAHTFHIFFE